MTKEDTQYSLTPNDDVEWTSCCRKRGKCPQVAATKDHVLIKDDFNKTIMVSKSSLSVLIEELQKIHADS